MFGEEVSADELFNMFFGGNQGFRSTGFGGPGIRFQTFGGGPQRRPAAGQAQQSAWVQLLPLFILIGFAFITQLPSLFMTQPPPDPSYSFERSSFHNLARQTHTNAKVDYFVNTRQFAGHPFFASLLKANPTELTFEPSSDDPKSLDYINQLVETAKTYEALPEKLVIPREYLRFEQNVEQNYLQRLQTMCNHENQQKSERLMHARGFFGLGADWDKIREIEKTELTHCVKLRKLGYRVNTV